MGVLLATHAGAQEQPSSSFDLLWKTATGGGFVLRLGRGTFLMDKDGRALALNRFSPEGRLVETLSGQLDGDQWKRQIIYSDPASGGAFVVRLRDGKLKQPYHEELRRPGREKGLFEIVTRDWDAARKDYVVTQSVVQVTEDATRIYETGCYNNLNSQERVDHLVRDLAKTGSLGALTCTGGDEGMSPTFDRLPYGAIIGANCGAGPGGAARRTRIEREFKEMLQRLTSCLAGFGERGLGLAAQVAGLIQQGADSPVYPNYKPRVADSYRKLPHCTDPNPFAIDCKSEPCSNFLAEAATGPDESDWPRMLLNTGKIDDLIVNNPNEVQSTLAHELLHNTGVFHGRDVDKCFAVQAACFPESNDNHLDPRIVRRGRDAAGRILSGDYDHGAEPHLNGNYLTDILHVSEAQGRDDYRVMLPMMTLGEIPRATRPSRAPVVIERMLADQMHQGQYTYVYHLATRQAQEMHLPEAHRRRMREIAAAASPLMGSEGLTTMETRVAELLAELTVHYENGNWRGLVETLRRPGAGNVQLVADLNEALNMERRQTRQQQRPGHTEPTTFRLRAAAHLYAMLQGAASDAFDNSREVEADRARSDAMFDDGLFLRRVGKYAVERSPDLNPACTAAAPAKKGS
jgi:hypothetical protein